MDIPGETRNLPILSTKAASVKSVAITTVILTSATLTKSPMTVGAVRWKHAARAPLAVRFVPAMAPDHLQGRRRLGNRGEGCRWEAADPSWGWISEVSGEAWGFGSLPRPERQDHRCAFHQRRKGQDSASCEAWLQSENQFSRCKKGKRPDLGGTFFRSSWEANYARILNHQGVRWQYEPETFQVGESETYTPDFKLEDGTLVEIKGWWTESGKRKVNLFQSKYPTMKLEIVTRKEYTALSKTYRNLITNWE